jgi:sec-independent protein translocase protein TatB
VFDISFFELLVVGVVALIVIGPERLPGAIRTGALWIGRIKRSLAETRRELEKQIGADEIRRELHNEQVLHNLEKMKDTRLELEERIRRITTGEYLNDDSAVDTAQQPAAQSTEQQSITQQPSTQQPTTAESSPAVEGPGEAPAPPNYDEHATQSAPSDPAVPQPAVDHQPKH